MLRKHFKRLVTRFNGYVYDFSVDYNATNVNDILDTHKYLIKKKHIV